MDLLLVVLAIIAVAGVAIHALLWHTVPGYRNQLLFHLASLCGFVAVLIVALR